MIWGRYNRLLDLAAAEYAPNRLAADRSILRWSLARNIRQRFTKELGYITPKIGVQGALFNAEGKILLEQRVDDALWGLPAGWVEAGERPETAVVREFRKRPACHSRTDGHHRILYPPAGRIPASRIPPFISYMPVQLPGRQPQIFP
jgi:hypothetical protein